MLAVVAVLALFVVGIAVWALVSHHSEKAMNQMDEAKSVSGLVSALLKWQVLAAVATLICFGLVVMANKASQTPRPVPTPYQTP